MSRPISTPAHNSAQSTASNPKNRLGSRKSRAVDHAPDWSDPKYSKNLRLIVRRMNVKPQERRPGIRRRIRTKAGRNVCAPCFDQHKQTSKVQQGAPVTEVTPLKKNASMIMPNRELSADNGSLSDSFNSNFAIVLRVGGVATRSNQLHQ